jgi:hypothetical protein
MDLFTSQVVSAVGITLVHFLWQGAAIGLVTAAVLATCPRAMAGTRYTIAGVGLLAMAAAPVLTLALVWRMAAAPSTGPSFGETVSVQASTALARTFPTDLASWLPLAVATWAVGVLILTMRLVVAWVRTERVRRRDLQPIGDGLAIAVRRLATALGIRRPVAVF